jgi:hypothetical protein
MRDGVARFAGLFAFLFAGLLGSVLPACSLLAPSDEALMGGPSNVPPEPPISDGLVFWLDGATGVETVETDAANPKIERWRDLSGNERDATQADVGLQPAWIDDETSHRQVPLFSLGADMRIPDVPLDAQGFTLVLQVGPLSYAASDVPVAFGADGPRLVGEDDLDLSFRLTAVDMNADDIDSPFAWVPGRPALTVAQVAEDGTASVRVDGHPVLETRMVEPITGTFELTLGKSAATFAVLGLYDRALDVAEAEQVEAAIRKRWACCNP